MNKQPQAELYCPSLFQYQRRESREVKVGNVGVGGKNPIRVQSMTISDTLNTEAVVKEAIGLIEAGCEIVRITAPTIHHAENLKNIRDQLRAKGYQTPLVADIHFTPQAAMIAAEYVEKVRINPGNFADRKLFNVREYTDSEYEAELERIKEKFIPLVQKCKERGVAMRIGTNHGSLSDRIMNRYGDTPQGMVESALEFLRIAEAQNYHEIILSMKASNPQVMVQAYRLLVARMNQEGMNYPLHLGVTEAGEGEDGRIKSAVGILTLLEDGIGDTVRVSLTEDSIHEIPVAKAMVKKFNEDLPLPPPSQRGGISFPSPYQGEGQGEVVPWNPFEYTRRPSETVKTGPIHVGGKHVVRVLSACSWPLSASQKEELEKNTAQLIREERIPEIISFDLSQVGPEEVDEFLVFAKDFKEKFSKQVAIAIDLKDSTFLFPLLAGGVDKISIAPSREKNEEGWKAQAIELLRIAKQQENLALEWRLAEEYLPAFEKNGAKLLLELARLSQSEGIERFGLCWAGPNWVYENRALVSQLHQAQIEAVIHLMPPLHNASAILDSSGQIGCLLLDGIGDSIQVSANNFSNSVHLAYNILQAARQRVTKTEFIACPSCGRTLFDLQTTTARIKKITSHLKGVKIAIMGCIVNGPGEMADADFGYVGGGPNKIHLYVGKECVEKNIPQEEADQRLVELIKNHGRWVEPVGEGGISCKV